MTVAQADGTIVATIAGIDPNTVDGSDLVLVPVEAGDSSISWSWSGTVPATFIPRR
jgi:hypothetical protein